MIVTKVCVLPLLRGIVSKEKRSTTRLQRVLRKFCSRALFFFFQNSLIDNIFLHPSKLILKPQLQHFFLAYNALIVPRIQKALIRKPPIFYLRFHIKE